MNNMTYKGYRARIEFDERDYVFVGRVLGLRDIISFHADSVVELHAAFSAAVDDYLADCAEQKLKILLDERVEAGLAGKVSTKSVAEVLDEELARIGIARLRPDR